MLKHKRNSKYNSINSQVSKKNSVKKKIFNRLRIKDVDEPIRMALSAFLDEFPDTTIDHIKSPRLMFRITVNYIRHQCTNYDELLFKYDVSQYNVSKYGHNDFQMKSFKEYVNTRIVKKFKSKLNIDSNTFYKSLI